MEISVVMISLASFSEKIQRKNSAEFIKVLKLCQSVIHYSSYALQEK